MANDVKQLYDSQSNLFYPLTQASKVGFNSGKKDDQGRDIVNVEDALIDIYDKLAAKAPESSSEGARLKIFIGSEEKYKAFTKSEHTNSSYKLSLKNGATGTWNDSSWTSTSPATTDATPYLYKLSKLKFKYYYAGSGNPVDLNSEYDDVDWKLEFIGEKGAAGVDSDTKEYVYCRMKTYEDIRVTKASELERTKLNWSDQDDAIPTGETLTWTDDPKGLLGSDNDDYVVEWCWWRDKVIKKDNNDNPIINSITGKPETEWKYPLDGPIIWAKAGNDGVDGTEFNNIYNAFDYPLADTYPLGVIQDTLSQVIALLNSDKTSSRPTVFNSKTNKLELNTSLLNKGWTDNPGNHPGKYVYLVLGFFTSGNIIESGFKYYNLLSWSEPVCITGEDGVAGTDGSDVEYAYCLSTDEELVPDYPPNGEEITRTPDYSNKVLGEWFDNPQGVDLINRVEFMSMRTAKYNELLLDKVWSGWSHPVVWSSYGKEGLDGDGIQYVFARVTQSVYDKISSGIYSWEDADWEPENVPRYNETLEIETIPVTIFSDGTRIEWTDDPEGVDPEYPYEFVAIRKYTDLEIEENTVDDSNLPITEIKKVKGWTEFSTPTVWAHYGKDASGFTLILENPQDVVYYQRKVEELTLDEEGISTGRIIIPGEDAPLYNLWIQSEESNKNVWKPIVNLCIADRNSITITKSGWQITFNLKKSNDRGYMEYALEVTKVKLLRGTNGAFNTKTVEYDTSDENGNIKHIVEELEILASNICRIPIKATGSQHPDAEHLTNFTLTAIQDINGDGFFKYELRASTYNVNKKLTGYCKKGANGEGLWTNKQTIYQIGTSTLSSPSSSGNIYISIYKNPLYKAGYILPDDEQCVVLGYYGDGRKAYDSGIRNGGRITLPVNGTEGNLLDSICEFGSIVFKLYTNDPDYQNCTENYDYPGFYFVDTMSIGGSVSDLTVIEGADGEKGNDGTPGAAGISFDLENTNPSFNFFIKENKEDNNISYGTVDGVADELGASETIITLYRNGVLFDGAEITVGNHSGTGSGSFTATNQISCNFSVSSNGSSSWKINISSIYNIKDAEDVGFSIPITIDFTDNEESKLRFTSFSAYRVLDKDMDGDAFLYELDTTPVILKEDNDELEDIEIKITTVKVLGSFNDTNYPENVLLQIIPCNSSYSTSIEGIYYDTTSESYYKTIDKANAHPWKYLDYLNLTGANLKEMKGCTVKGYVQDEDYSERTECPISGYLDYYLFDEKFINVPQSVDVEEAVREYLSDFLLDNDYVTLGNPYDIFRITSDNKLTEKQASYHSIDTNVTIDTVKMKIGLLSDSGITYGSEFEIPKSTASSKNSVTGKGFSDIYYFDDSKQIVIQGEANSSWAFGSGAYFEVSFEYTKNSEPLKKKASFKIITMKDASGDGKVTEYFLKPNIEEYIEFNHSDSSKTYSPTTINFIVCKDKDGEVSIHQINTINSSTGKIDADPDIELYLLVYNVNKWEIVKSLSWELIENFLKNNPNPLFRLACPTYHTGDLNRLCGDYDVTVNTYLSTFNVTISGSTKNFTVVDEVTIHKIGSISDPGEASQGPAGRVGLACRIRRCDISNTNTLSVQGATEFYAIGDNATHDGWNGIDGKKLALFYDVITIDTKDKTNNKPIKYYLCKSSHQSNSGTPSNISVSKQGNGTYTVTVTSNAWEEAESFDFLLANTLIAEYANIDSLLASKILVGNTKTSPSNWEAGMINGFDKINNETNNTNIRIFAGAAGLELAHIDEAPFRVDKYGNVTAKSIIALGNFIYPVEKDSLSKLIYFRRLTNNDYTTNYITSDFYKHSKYPWLKYKDSVEFLYLDLYIVSPYFNLKNILLGPNNRSCVYLSYDWLTSGNDITLDFNSGMLSNLNTENIVLYFPGYLWRQQRRKALNSTVWKSSYNEGESVGVLYITALGNTATAAYSDLKYDKIYEINRIKCKPLTNVSGTTEFFSESKLNSLIDKTFAIHLKNIPDSFALYWIGTKKDAYYYYDDIIGQSLNKSSLGNNITLLATMRLSDVRSERYVTKNVGKSIELLYFYRPSYFWEIVLMDRDTTSYDSAVTLEDSAFSYDIWEQKIDEYLNYWWHLVTTNLEGNGLATSVEELMNEFLAWWGNPSEGLTTDVFFGDFEIFLLEYGNNFNHNSDWPFS